MESIEGKPGKPFRCGSSSSYFCVLFTWFASPSPVTTIRASARRLYQRCMEVAGERSWLHLQMASMYNLEENFCMTANHLQAAEDLAPGAMATYDRTAMATVKALAKSRRR